jgi:hypothetical protein
MIMLNGGMFSSANSRVVIPRCEQCEAFCIDKRAAPLGDGYYAGRKPARASAARPSSEASAARNARTAGRCFRDVTSAKS